MKHKRHYVLPALAGFAAALSAGTTHVRAASATWQNLGTDWNTDANWSATPYPGSSTADVATFATAASTQPNLSASASLGTILFSTTTSAGYTISGSTITLNNTGTGTTTSAVHGANSSGTNTISANIVLGGAAATTARFNQLQSGTLVLSGNISSTNAITGVRMEPATNSFGAVFQISGNNSYSGTSTLGWANFDILSNSAFSSGALVLSNHPNFINSSGTTVTLPNAVTVPSGIPLYYNNSNLITSTGDLVFSGVNGPVDCSGGERTITVGSGGGKLILQNLSVGTTRKTKSGSGILRVEGPVAGTGANAFTIGGVAYSGYRWRVTGGVLEIASPAVVGDTLDLRAGLQAGANLTGANKLTATIVMGDTNATITGTNDIELGGPFNLNPGSRTVTINNAGSTTFSGPVNITDNVADATQTLTVSVASTAGPSTISGVIQNLAGGGASTNPMAFAKSGSGTLTLTNSNTFTGGLTVSGGTLIANHASALGASTGSVTVNGGVLQLATGTTYTVGSLNLLNTFGSGVSFALSASSGMASKITGTGSASFDAPISVSVPVSSPAPGATWNILGSTLSKTFGANFAVQGWTGSVASGAWTFGDTNGVYTFNQTTGTITFAADADGDGLDDAWEISNFGNIAAYSGPDDPDNDGYTNVEEQAGGSNPNVTASIPGDTDGDGLTDSWEIANFGNIAAQNASGDPDGDGTNNAAEMAAGSSPNDSSWTPNRAKLAHRWNFNGNLNDTGTATTLSNATIVEVGANDVTQNADSVTLAGGTNATSDYVRLGSNLIGGKTTPVTIELWATQNSVQSWSRILEFGSTTSENLLMSWSQGTNANQDRVEWRDISATSTSNNTNAPYAIGTKYHIVMTLTPAAFTGGAISSGTRVTWYRAAATPGQPLWTQRGTFDSANTLTAFADSNDWLGRSSSGDNVANATYDEVRLWDGALTQTERTVAQAAGPNVTDLTTDADSDGLPDSWETAHFGNTSQGDVDSDGDGTTNSDELAGQSNPNSSGSTLSDTDGDGLDDAGFELVYFGNLDQSGSADPDQDFNSNLVEQAAGSNPTSNTSWPDNDNGDGTGDSLNDGWEDHYFGNGDGVATTTELALQNDTNDPDGDGEDNYTEQSYGTNPMDFVSRHILPTLFTFIDVSKRNGSFELLGTIPGSVNGAKASNWDTDSDGDVTYWTEWNFGSDYVTGNSGTETGGTNTDGVKHAFMENGNAVYNPTDYVAAAGNIYWFSFDKLNANDLDAYLVYFDGIYVLPIIDSKLTSTTTGNGQMKGYQIPAGSPAIGKRIGIGFKSRSSWAAFDSVRFGVQASDTDSDGYDDASEDQLWGDNDGLVESSDLAAGPAGDGDGDGISSLNEINGTLNTAYGNQPTKANDPDSDDDGLTDGQEINTFATNPNSADTDGDGLSDGVETNTGVFVSASNTGSDPLIADSDGDGFKDGQEVAYGTDPNDLNSVPVVHELIGLTKRNGSFEKLNGVVSTAKASNWDTDSDGDVDNWTIWTEQSTASNDSGTETTGSAFRDGAKHGYLQNGNAARNMTPYVIKAGDLIRLTCSRTTAGNLTAYLISDTGAGIVQLPGATSQLTNATGPKELFFVVPAGHASIGQPLGVAFKSTGGWEGVDKVVLTVQDQDSDGDGLSDFWEEKWFGNANDNIDAGELALARGTAAQSPTLGTSADNDNDGFNNESEETAGSNPLDAASTPDDVDGDGLADVWELANFGSTSTQNATGDPDGDGSNNLTEYRLGLNPNDGSSRFNAVLSGAQLSWQGKAGLSFTIQRTTNLSGWANLATVSGVNGTNTYTDPSPLAGKAFYRVLLNP